MSSSSNHNTQGPVRHILLLPRGTKDELYGVYAMETSSYFQGEGGPATGDPSEIIIDPQVTYSFLQGVLARIADIDDRPPSKRTLVLMLKELKDINPFNFSAVKNLFAVDGHFWESILDNLRDIKRTGTDSRILLMTGLNIENGLLSEED